IAQTLPPATQARLYQNLGDGYRHGKRPADAAAAYQTSVGLLEALERENPDNWAYQQDLGQTIHLLALVLRARTGSRTPRRRFFGPGSCNDNSSGTAPRCRVSGPTWQTPAITWAISTGRSSGGTRPIPRSRRRSRSTSGWPANTLL